MTYLFNMWREYFQGCTGESPISERSSGDGGSDKDGFYSLLKGNEKKISSQYLLNWLQMFKTLYLFLIKYKWQLGKGGHRQYFPPNFYFTGIVCMFHTLRYT